MTPIFWSPGFERRCFPLFLILALAAGCSTLQQLSQTQRPETRFQSVHLQGLDYQGIDLVFDVLVKNPNQTGISLDGYNYRLNIAGQQFLSGENTEGVSIPSSGEQVVQLPTRLEYASLSKILGTLANQKSFAYQLDSAFQFQVPILGTVSVPLKKTGELPVVRPPQIGFGGVAVKNISLSGAEVELNFDILNPNAFALNLEEMAYDFVVNGNTWAQVKNVSPTPLKPDQPARLTLPVSLNFLEQGRTAYQILTGRGDANYRMDGSMKLTSPLPLIDQVNLPFQKSGNLAISKK